MRMKIVSERARERLKSRPTPISRVRDIDDLNLFQMTQDDLK